MTPESTPPEKPRRRRFVLSLRALMVLVLVVGGGIGWKVNRANHQRRALAALEQMGAEVLFDYEYSDGKDIENGKPWAPGWLSKYVGDEYFQEITGVRFFSCKEKLKDSDLACLYGLDRLESLNLTRSDSRRQEPDGMDVTDAGLAYLERSPRLRTLDLTNTRITDVGFAKLSLRNCLEELSLERTKVTVTGLAHLQALKFLRKLELNAACSTDEGIAQVVKLNTLQGLKIGRPSTITDAGLGQLRRLPDLQELEISGNLLTDESLSIIKGLKTIKKLKIFVSPLAQSRITDAGLAHIGDMPEIETLWLRILGSSGRRASITDAGLAHLRRLTKLRELHLHLWDTHITDEGLAHLKGLTELRELDLSCQRITDAGLVHLEGMTKLEVLWIMEGEITDAGLAHLRKLNSLKMLRLMSTRVTNTGVLTLKAALPSLTDADCIGSKPPANAAPRQSSGTGEVEEFVIPPVPPPI